MISYILKVLLCVCLFDPALLQNVGVSVHRPFEVTLDDFNSLRNLLMEHKKEADERQASQQTQLQQQKDEIDHLSALLTSADEHQASQQVQLQKQRDEIEHLSALLTSADNRYAEMEYSLQSQIDEEFKALTQSADKRYAELEYKLQAQIEGQPKALTQKADDRSASKQSQIQREKSNQFSSVERSKKLFGNEKRKTNKNSTMQAYRDPDTYTKSAFACSFDILQLSCPDSRTINVVSAYYGQYRSECLEGCCPPHPMDCSESMEVNAPADWLILTGLCNNQTQCQVDNPGALLASCAEPYSSNYATAYYTCLPEDVTEPVGFSAYATASRTYNEDDIILFDGIITNVGGYYDPNASLFVCPYDGMYVFSLSFTSVSSGQVWASIMHEGQVIGTAYSVRTSNESHQPGLTVVKECFRGQRVWIKSNGDDFRMHGNHSKFSIFSGFLEHVFA